MMESDFQAQYAALTQAVALVDLTGRTQIELAGADRVRFLHNLCTNEIRKLAVGAGCEAFLTSVQGKTLAHVFVFAGPETLVVDTVAGQAEAILKHLDHYLVSEQVTLTDRSDEWGEVLVAGPAAAELLASLCGAELPGELLAHRSVALAGRPASLRRAEITAGGGFLVSAARDAVTTIVDAIVAAGAIPCAMAAFDAARIEHGFPLFGQDITPANLPQEVGRDRQAISFVKGCYLGQETVARIDALGHVNKLLVGLRFAGPGAPEAGLKVQNGQTDVGHVTSVAYSPRFQAAIGLGYVRRGHEASGTKLSSAAGEVEVVALPMI
jgi:folate-binding protein YgfZ